MECQTQLLLFKFPLDTVKIRDYPQEMWDELPTERWKELCSELEAYEPTGPQLQVKSVSRKWEMVSAYQKSVRRGLADRAKWLVTGFFSFPKKERAYFWKRICTTATEDVGFGDVELMNFVIACSQCFPPSSQSYVLKQVWSFLTEKM
jgi:replication-associated recombination protein RarA